MQEPPKIDEEESNRVSTYWKGDPVLRQGQGEMSKSPFMFRAQAPKNKELRSGFASVLICSSGWSWNLSPPASASRVLGLRLYTTLSDSHLNSPGNTKCHTAASLPATRHFQQVINHRLKSIVLLPHPYSDSLFCRPEFWVPD